MPVTQPIDYPVCFAFPKKRGGSTWCTLYCLLFAKSSKYMNGKKKTVYQRKKILTEEEARFFCVKGEGKRSAFILVFYCCVDNRLRTRLGNLGSVLNVGRSPLYYGRYRRHSS